MPFVISNPGDLALVNEYTALVSDLTDRLAASVRDLDGVIQNYDDLTTLGLSPSGKFFPLAEYHNDMEQATALAGMISLAKALREAMNGSGLALHS